MSSRAAPPLSRAAAIGLVDSLLREAEAEVGTYDDDPRGYHARYRTAMEGVARQLEAALNARISSRWDGSRVRMLGIASSSTSGLGGAFRNWLAAARKREGIV